MKKRIYSVILAVVMVMTLLPTVAFAAATDYGICVGSAKVTSANADNVLGDSGTPTVTYDAGSNTLTLNGANITSVVPVGTGAGQNGSTAYTGGIFRNTNDLNIVLHGTNTIGISTDNNSRFTGIYAGGKVSIKGTEADSLSVVNTAKTPSCTMGIYGETGMTIDGCTVTATASPTTGNENTIGIYVRNGSLAIKNAVVTGNGGSTMRASLGIAVDLGSLSIENSTVTANGGVGAWSYGLETLNNTTSTISGSTVTATGNTLALSCTKAPNTTGLVTASTNINGSGASAVTISAASSTTNTYKYVQLVPPPVSFGTLSVSSSYTAGQDLVLSDLTAPTVTPKTGVTVTAQGWQNSVAVIGGSDSWSNWTGGVLSPITTLTYKLRYYATCSGGTFYSNEVTLNVVGNTTALALAVSPASPQSTGTPITLTATLTGFFTGPGVNGQTVTFKNGGATLGTATLDTGGVATYTWTPSSAATYSLTAIYGGSAYNTAVTSTAVTYSITTATSPTLTAGAVTRTSDTTATVKFTSNVGGTYYYSLGSAVTDTTTGGTAFTAGETTISLTGLAAGAKDIYIVAKDASGNVSVTTFKITLPAYGADTTAPTLTAGTVTRTSDTTATVKFTSNEGGTYYCSVGGAVTNTSTGGTAFSAGETTISLTGLTAGAKDIYIVVKDASGNVSATTFKITIPAYVAPTYDVGGTVKDSAKNLLSGASVKLMSGQTQIGSTVTTDANGVFTISGIPNGTYNLVVSKDGIVVTSIITVNNGDCAAGTIALPAGITNSVVEIKASTPAIVVGNLNEQFGAVAADNDKGVTAADQAVVSGSGSVEIKLTAEGKTQSNATNAGDITATATSDGNTVGIYIDLSVMKTVTPNGGTEEKTILTQLPTLIEVLIPLEASLQGKSNYVVYRYHGTAVDTITKTPSDGEKLELIDNGATLKLTVKKFCTYAIGYAKTVATPIGDPGAGGTSSAITIAQSNGGKITVSDDKKTAAIAPNDGYVIADVLVDGKSVGATEKYTFTDSNAHKIAAVFVKKSALPYYLQNDAKIYIGFSAISGNLYKYVAPAGVDVKFAENPKSFTDNTIAWAKPGIDFVTERELFLGTAQNSFSPNSAMTRAMFVTVIGRLYERSYGSVSGSGTFSDVDTNAYYAKYVAWASENGIIKGIGENKFAPEENVTREQMAVIMQSFAAFLKKADVTDVSLTYPDSASISSWATEGAKYCQQTQVITGRDGGSFAPQESATRAEVAVVIERFINTIVE